MSRRKQEIRQDLMRVLRPEVWQLILDYMDLTSQELIEGMVQEKDMERLPSWQGQILCLRNLGCEFRTLNPVKDRPSR